jgi:2-polyprenyl-3-methyl-5-hydroxy-6-metoxy-1,4-benzoquinol methylase
MKSLFRVFVQANVRASHWIDQRVPARLRVDGNQDYRNDFVWRYLRPRQTVYDIGGGKQPFLSPAEKHKLKCRVVGLDISPHELSSAPDGVYDKVIVGDIVLFQGAGDADIVLCRAVLEHVADVPAAIGSVASILKPGGVCLLFIPCRNAAFARLNLLLPESIKRRLLFSAFPAAKLTQGFPSYYNRCTPRAISKLAAHAGLSVIETRQYYMSSYFSVLLPLQVVWRAWTIIVSAIRAENLCETFSIALKKSLDQPAV